MATIRDVAERAHVACSTVSHVFNGTASISDDTRLRVLQVAEELGYIPRTIRNPRRSLARKVIMFKRVGQGSNASIADGSEDFADPIMAAAFRCLKEQGYGVWMLPHSDDEMDHCIHSINVMDFSGALVVDNILETFSTFPTLPMPTVLAYCETQNHNSLSVVPDDFRGAFEAVDHLIHLGHKRIAFLNGPKGWFACTARLQGYRAALQGAGIAEDPQLIINGDWTVQRGRSSMIELLQGPKPTAVFAANDLLAIGAMKGIRELGLTVPKDVAVIGFDNRMFAEFSDPPLTTVNLPLTNIGERAALELIRMMRTAPHHNNQVSRIQIHCPLVIRESCGARVRMETAIQDETNPTVTTS